MYNENKIDFIEALDRIISISILSYILARFFSVSSVLMQMIYWDMMAGLFSISAGILLFIRLFNNRFNNYLEVLSHELTHAFFSILSGNKVLRIFATEYEGFVEYRGRGNWLITLSPYFFPLHTAGLIYLVYLFELENYWYFKIIILTSYLFYLLTVSKQFDFRQSDIQKSGIPFSILIVSSFHLILGFIMIFLIQGNLNQMVEVFVFG